MKKSNYYTITLDTMSDLFNNYRHLDSNDYINIDVLTYLATYDQIAQTSLNRELTQTERNTATATKKSIYNLLYVLIALNPLEEIDNKLLLIKNTMLTTSNNVITIDYSKYDNLFTACNYLMSLGDVYDFNKATQKVINDLEKNPVYYLDKFSGLILKR